MLREGRVRAFSPELRFSDHAAGCYYSTGGLSRRTHRVRCGIALEGTCCRGTHSQPKAEVVLCNLAGTSELLQPNQRGVLAHGSIMLTLQYLLFSRAAVLVTPVQVLAWPCFIQLGWESR